MAETDYRCDPWCPALHDYCGIGNHPATCKYACYRKTEEGLTELTNTCVDKNLERKVLIVENREE